LENDSAKSYTIQANKTEDININNHLKRNCYLLESESQRSYFYLLSPSTVYCYRGNGILWNETLNQITESQNIEKRPGYIIIKSLINIECAISGFDGANYQVNQNHNIVYFSRTDGGYILRILDSNGNLRRFKVNSGRCYCVINTERCIDMDTNSVLPLYEGQDEIELEARNFEALVQLQMK
jgi:hypothetical protein